MQPVHYNANQMVYGIQIYQCKSEQLQFYHCVKIRNDRYVLYIPKNTIKFISSLKNLN